MTAVSLLFIMLMPVLCFAVTAFLLAATQKVVAYYKANKPVAPMRIQKSSAWAAAALK